MPKGARRPKLPRDEQQNKLYEWALRQYFDYHAEKQRLGGFPAELEGRALSRIKYAPEITNADLLTELVKQYLASIWHADPVIPPPSEPQTEGAEASRPDSASVEDDSVDDDDDGDVVIPDLFTVAGVVLPPSFTVADATVPGGFRRVLRRWSTVRVVQRDAQIKQQKADESVEAAKRALDDAATITAAIRDPDALLWDHRDGLRARPSPETHTTP